MSLFKFLGVSIIGIATALLIAIAETVISNLTGFNVFGFSFFVVIPVGALLVGAAAASGYYFGCKYLQLRPGLFLIVQMIAVAAATNLLIYYLEYQTLVLDDGTRASAVVGFAEYLDISLTQTELRVGRGATPTGPVGEFGYWLAIIEFVGFLVGGLFVVLMLFTAPTCKPCNLFYRRRAVKERHFESGDAAGAYYDNLFANPVDSVEFAAKSNLGASKGNVRMTTTLFECPKCKVQMWRDEAAVWNGQDWKHLNDLERSILIPEGLDMTPLLRDGGAPIDSPPSAGGRETA